MRSPSKRKRRELDWTPFRCAYVSKTLDILVVFLILKKVSSPVCKTTMEERASVKHRAWECFQVASQKNCSNTTKIRFCLDCQLSQFKCERNRIDKTSKENRANSTQPRLEGCVQSYRKVIIKGRQACQSYFLLVPLSNPRRPRCSQWQCRETWCNGSSCLPDHGHGW
jgi:hypothetical protein